MSTGKDLQLVAFMDVLDAVTGYARTPMDPQEEHARMMLVAGLLEFYGGADEGRADVYLRETLDVPLYWLAIGLRVMLRDRVYPTLPTVGDLLRCARHCAGMDRDRYDAGHYLPPSTTWPPAQYRHAVQFGELEPLSEHTVRALPPLATNADRLLGSQVVTPSAPCLPLGESTGDD